MEEENIRILSRVSGLEKQGIHQKYGKLRNAIMWLPGGCGTYNFQNILITCSSKCIQDFKSF